MPASPPVMISYMVTAGGYLQPVLGSPSRQIEPIPDVIPQAGMMLVVQPNVVTKDEAAGVQTGECVLIRRENVHNYTEHRQ
jgi:hypothetical protein